MPNLRNRLHFDPALGTVTDGPRRYVLLRHDVLMGTVAALPQALRPTVLAAMSDSVAVHGADSLRAYLADCGGDTEALIEATIDAAADLGWGRWAVNGNFLYVKNSPFAAGFGPSDSPVCSCIVGMWRALSTIVAGRRMEVRETRCTAQGHERCEFVATDHSPP